VNPGATDDLRELARIARGEDLWFHVDGAFGAFAALAPSLADVVAGMEEADSLAVDLHKWGYLPFEVGLALVRDEAAHRAAFATRSSYLEPTPRGIVAGGLPFAELGVQLSRGFHALKVWMSFKTYGRAVRASRRDHQPSEQAEGLRSAGGGRNGYRRGADCPGLTKPKETDSQMRIETLAVHAGRTPDPATGAVSPPIYLSTTFARAEDLSLPGGFLYARQDNPNRHTLEATLAPLEGGAVALAFASGMAASAAVFQSLAPGDHVVAPTDAYYGTAKFLREVLAPWGLKTSFVNMTDLEAVEAAITPRTRLVWVETPSNPALAVTDIARVAEIAHGAGARCACDNTWATPLLQRPLDLGADIVMHATTKYLGGHSDVTSGALVLKEDGELAAKLRTIQTVGGAVPSAFDCWLVARGIRTLPYRIRAHCDNAERVAGFLAGHRKVETVHYPGLESDPGHAVARRQMTRAGGMVSFEVRGGADPARAVVSRLRLFTRATSLGGPESLIEHRASVEGPESRTPPGLLRCSIGLEHPDDLIEDLAQALG
jgi:cystathionine gamma-synthase